MYIVVGASGFLGSYIVKSILDLTAENIIAVARNANDLKENERIKYVSCDITDFSSVDDLCASLSASNVPLNVIYLAAYHNPDLVEQNPQFAWNVNVTSLSYFVNKIPNVRCFFYPSTDSVYGESFNNYHFKETDGLHPVNTYGKQKVVAEQIVRGYGHNVVRYPFLIGKSESPIKKHFYDQIVSDLKSGKSVKMFKDSLRSTISFKQAATMLIQLCERYTENLPKTINICGDDDLSKYNVGCHIATKLGVSEKNIIPISIQDDSTIFKTKRASSTLMDNTLIKKILNVKKIKLEV